MKSRLYLITGFLGAGKTTFIKGFLRLFAGQKILLIVNEFGQEGVDGPLLSELGTFLQEISGGSVFCSCRLDQFEKVLRQSADLEPDVILVEGSGLSDPTGVRRLFGQTDRFPHIDYRGGVCLIDAVRFPKLIATARPCVRQLAASDVVVLNKIDRASEEQLEATRKLIREQRPEIPVVETTYGKVDASLLELLEQAPQTDTPEGMHQADLTLHKLMVTLSPEIPPYSLKKFIEMFLEDTYRVKGFIQTSEGLYLVDCVGNVVSMEPHDSAKIPPERIGHLVVLSGAGMRARKQVKEATKWYGEYVLSIE